MVATGNLPEPGDLAKIVDATMRVRALELVAK
jgi:hypothetical protein